MNQKILFFIICIVPFFIVGAGGDVHASSVSLESLTQDYLQSSQELRASEERVKANKIKTWKTFRDFFPKADFRYEKTKGESLSGPFHGKTYALDFEQPIFMGGKLYYSYIASRLEVVMAEYESKRLTNERVYKIAEVYYKVLFEQKRKDIYLRLKRKASSVMHIAKKSYQKGYISLSERVNVQSKFMQFKTFLLDAMESSKIASYELKTELEIDYFFFPISSLVMQEKTIIYSADELIEVALAHNPEYQYMKKKVELAKAHKNIAFSDNLPSFSVLGSYGKGLETHKQNDLDLRKEWMLGAKAQWQFAGSHVEVANTKKTQAPVVRSTRSNTESVLSAKIGVLDSLDTLAQTKEKEAEYKMFVAQIKKKERELFLNVKKAYSEYMRALFMRKSSLIGMKFQKIYAKVQYHNLMNKKISYSDYLDSLNELAKKSIEFEKSLLECNMKVAELTKLVGTDISVSVLQHVVDSKDNERDGEIE